MFFINADCGVGYRFTLRFHESQRFFFLPHLQLIAAFRRIYCTIRSLKFKNVLRPLLLVVTTPTLPKKGEKHNHSYVINLIFVLALFHRFILS